MRAAFHAYPDGQYFCPSYDRSQPFRANVAEFDRTGEYSTSACMFIATEERYMHFYVNMLWQAVPDGAYLTPLFFIKRVGWSAFLELAGTDMITREPGSTHNQGLELVRSVHLNAGDAVQARPCVAAGSGLVLAPAVSGDGINTCNYFGGFEIC